MRQFKIEKAKVRFASFVVLMLVVFCGVIWLIFARGGGSDYVELKRGGLNTLLPPARLKKDSLRDKLSFYAVASQDSMKRMERLRMDPNRGGNDQTSSGNINHVRTGASAPSDDDEALAGKIKQIRRQLTEVKRDDYVVTEQVPSLKTHPLKRATEEPARDPEMDAINATLDKLLEVQRPGKAMATTREQQGTTVSATEESQETFFGKSSSAKKTSSFYGDEKGAAAGSVIPAVMMTSQVAQNGAVVRLELSMPIAVNGTRLPAGTPVFGVANLAGERLRIQISSIRWKDNLIPVSLSVYDMDGIEGIYVPGSLQTDVLKESADHAIQSTGLAGLDFSLKTQAAATGINAAKSLLSKKVKQVRVTITAGYKVLLQDNHGL
ncbi:MAG: conjugative transposon protein TraM [Sediminibacterium magnilacihabitans]|jgi:conjugative transposon TraM protein|nr:conjugative transposon protein TraM [Sediminibacterium magnilacihabitans]PQV60412.1 conjugative transposon TraM protein [Sediminibacterium magnilacihabitans]